MFEKHLPPLPGNAGLGILDARGTVHTSAAPVDAVLWHPYRGGLAIHTYTRGRNLQDPRTTFNTK